jgi:hypothetical protein
MTAAERYVHAILIAGISPSLLRLRGAPKPLTLVERMDRRMGTQTICHRCLEGIVGDPVFVRNECLCATCAGVRAWL